LNTLSFALLLVLETGLVEPVKTSLSPLRPKRIIGEPLVVSVLLLDGGKSTAKEVPRMHGWWEYREGAGEWRACSRPGTSSAVPSEFENTPNGAAPTPGGTVLGLAGVSCLETAELKLFALRLRSDSPCCQSTEAATLSVEEGTPADARARAAGDAVVEHTDSILAEYAFLSWPRSDRLYDDPVAALREHYYLNLSADELGPSTGQITQFLARFPKFPLTRSLRMRLATQLAILGHIPEAQRELQKITFSPLEPHALEDAKALQTAISSRPRGKTD